MNWKNVDKSQIETIEILPYLDCYDIALANLISKGYDEETLRLAEECDVLGNVPYILFGRTLRARKSRDLNGVECYYAYPSGYKIPLDFVKGDD